MFLSVRRESLNLAPSLGLCLRGLKGKGIALILLLQTFHTLHAAGNEQEGTEPKNPKCELQALGPEEQINDEITHALWLWSKKYNDLDMLHLKDIEKVLVLKKMAEARQLDILHHPDLTEFWRYLQRKSLEYGKSKAHF